MSDSQSKKPGVYIKTFGCQMNVYDSEKLERLLEDRYTPVDTPEQAKLVIVNTCSVRDKAEHKLYSMLGELRDLKRQFPELLVGVGGCVAQQEGQAIVDRSSAVDFVFGTHNLSLVPSMIDRRLEGFGPQVAVDYRDEWEDLPLGFSGSGRVSALVSISRGCNKNCTYCVVPMTRGPEISRAEDEILREVRIAVHRGAREVMLLGQTVNSWGRDFTPRRRFTELLDAVSAIAGVERIRFISPHPQEIREDFIELIARNPKICRHVHMPLQSGSNRILKAMNRNYRRERYLEIIEQLWASAPEISITTDIIVGFPGETEADFEQTMEVLDLVQFDSSFSFGFSPRPGTPAATFADQIPRETALERLQHLQTRQAQITTDRLLQWVGRTVPVLLDGPSAADPQRLSGRISQNILVNLTTLDQSLSPGMTVDTVITESARYTLKGELQLSRTQNLERVESALAG